MTDQLTFNSTEPYCASWHCKHPCGLKITKRVREMAAEQWKPIAIKERCVYMHLNEIKNNHLKVSFEIGNVKTNPTPSLAIPES